MLARPTAAAIVAACVLLMLLVPTAQGAASIKPLAKYGMLQCGVCEIMALEIGRRVNITNRNNAGASYQKSHRTEGNTQRRAGYEASELQAVEVLELLCQDIRKHSKFIQHPEQPVRLVVLDDSPLAREGKPPVLYTKREEAELHNVPGLAYDFCEAVLEDYEHVLVDNIKRHKRADKLVEGMCMYGLKVCEKSFIETAQRDEHRKHQAFLKTQSETRSAKRAGTSGKKDEL